jgi:cytochrome c2
MAFLSSLSLAALFVLSQASPAAPAATQPAGETVDPAQIERGQDVYTAQRCHTCHSIAGVGSRRYPLDGVGSRLTAEELRKWIVAPQEMQRGVRKRAYKLPESELKDLVAYLSSLKEDE